MKGERGVFSGKLGYVLATAGSAVGLGNLWRFPYLAAKYGGGIFLLVYLILAVTFGFTLLIAETSIGRKTGQSPASAFRNLHPKFGFLGAMGTLVPMIILPYYCVIGGWVVKYMLTFLMDLPSGNSSAVSEGYFSSFMSSTSQPLIFLAVFLIATCGIVVFGVEKGIEKASRLLMPMLVVLNVAICIFLCTRPGALEGIKYYLLPDFSKFSFMTVVAALGQMFFSLSIAMGILITYGSYMGKHIDMEKSIGQVELFDTGIAFLAGLMIVPAVFIFFNGDESHLNAGPSLMFITLPKVFDSMGTSGIFIGLIFFILVLFAALTSSIALMETVVSSLMDRLHWTRKRTCLLVLIGTMLLAMPTSLGFGVWSEFQIIGKSIFDLYDFLSNAVFMPLTALGTCLFISQVLGVQAIIDEVRISSAFKKEKMFVVILRYIAPVLLIVILISSLMEALGYIKV